MTGCSSNITSTDNDVYRYDNATVLVIGRCRTILSSGDDPWHGGLYIGYQKWAAVHAHNTSFERLNIFVHNDTVQKTYRRVIDHRVEFYNASGVFFWSKIGGGPAPIPPLVFVWCHADIVTVINFGV